MLLLLLAQDLQLQELLLLLQEAGIGRVHGQFTELLLLVRGDVLMVLEFLHPGLGLFALLAAVLVSGCLIGLALLRSTTQARRARSNLRCSMCRAMDAPTECHCQDILCTTTYYYSNTHSNKQLQISNSTVYS